MKALKAYDPKILALCSRILELCAPPDKLTVSQWADANRQLSPEASAEPGRWDSNRVPYQRGMMDEVNDPETEVVVIMSSAQIGKTEIINNVLGYYIDHEPSTILIVNATVEMGEAWSKDRFAPMIRDTKCLAQKIADPKTRGTSNTVKHKGFPGGHATVAGSNSPSSLASRPCRVILLDEVDRYPMSAGTEGDPTALAIKRSTTFWNRKILITSTPTIKGSSRVEHWYDRSSRHRRFLPCRQCGEYQTLKWSQVKWDDRDPETARYECEHCAAEWTDAQIAHADRLGEWRAEDPTQTRVKGFHINELYSPWVSLAETVGAFLAAKDAGADLLKVWVNTSLGETWEEAGETIDPASIFSNHRYHYDEVPDEATWLTAGVDVQKDRLELEIVAWAENRRSWSMDYRTIYGDPTSRPTDAASPWAELDQILRTEFSHAGEGVMRITSCFVDAGYLPDHVLPYCRDRARQGVYACRGDGGTGKAVLHRRSRNNRYRAPMFFLGVDTIKEAVYRNLSVQADGEAGYCAFPNEYGIDYFQQLTAERRQSRKVKGFTVWDWVLPPNARNEALDCRVYSYAALERIAPVRSTRLKERRIDVRAERVEGLGVGSAFGSGFNFGRSEGFF